MSVLHASRCINTVRNCLHHIADVMITFCMLSLADMQHADCVMFKWRELFFFSILSFFFVLLLIYVKSNECCKLVHTTPSSFCHTGLKLGTKLFGPCRLGHCSGLISRLLRLHARFFWKNWKFVIGAYFLCKWNWQIVRVLRLCKHFYCCRVCALNLTTLILF